MAPDLARIVRAAIFEIKSRLHRIEEALKHARGGNDSEPKDRRRTKPGQPEASKPRPKPPAAGAAAKPVAAKKTAKKRRGKRGRGQPGSGKPTTS